MEQDERETTAAAGSPATSQSSSGATRSQSVVQTLPHDWNAIGQFLRPALERVNAEAGETQLLVLTADAETAVAVARAALFGSESPSSAGGARVLGDDARAVDSDESYHENDEPDDAYDETLDADSTMIRPSRISRPPLPRTRW